VLIALIIHSHDVFVIFQFMIRWKGWLPDQMVDNMVARDYVQKARVSAM
jgi:hypothetical protein